MQPTPHRPISSHRESTRTSFRRTHSGFPAYFHNQPYIPKLKRLGYHSLDENPEECHLSSEPPPYSDIVTPPYPSPDGNLPLHALPSIGHDESPPTTPVMDEKPGESPSISSMSAESLKVPLYFSGRPTVFPVKDFDPIKDASKICKAMKGSDIDCMGIISILSKRSTEQRVTISEKFVELNKKEIEYDLTRSDYGNFEVLVVLSLEHLQDTVAFALYEYIKGLDTDENILIQGIVPYPNSFLREVANSYRKQFDADIIIDLFRHKKGHFRTILMALLQGIRDEDERVSMAGILYDVDILYKACEIPLSPNTEVFTRILTQRSFVQIKKIAEFYQSKYGVSLEQCIKDGKFGGYKDTYIAIIRYATDKEGLLAEWFHRSIQEASTDDWALMQLTLGRSEIDLQDVKDAYSRKYGKPLIKAISNATSGEYKRFLMAMVGCQ